MPRPFLIFSQSIYLIQIIDINRYWMGNSAYLVAFFRSQLFWIYTVWKGRTYPGSTGPGLMEGKGKTVMFTVTQSSLWIYPRVILQLVKETKIKTFFSFNLTTLWANLADDLIFFLFFFLENKDLTLHANCIKCQILVSGKNEKKNIYISKCYLLKILASMLNVKTHKQPVLDFNHWLSFFRLSCGKKETGFNLQIACSSIKL